MKSLAAFFALLTIALAQPAPPPPPPAYIPVDPEAREILRVSRDRSAYNKPGASPRERRLALEASNLAFVQLARDYLARHASGPDRAEVILALSARGAEFITSIDPAFDQTEDKAYIDYDTEAKARFRAEAKALVRSVRADLTATKSQRDRADRSLLMSGIQEATTAEEFATVQQQLERMATEGMDEYSIWLFQSRMFHPYSSLGMEAYGAYLDRLARSDHAMIRQAAEEARVTDAKVRDAISHLKFTAADGREVDLARLKGKVVLIDFWATWCGPCIAELPHVLETYAKYHDKGFEIIGIAFENSNLVTEADLPRLRTRKPEAKADTPEEATRKIEAARAKLLNFTAERGMPWPQHFDGKYWQNELGVYFGVRAIPAMFLVGQDGRLVSTNARGDRLEAEVKRLLGL